MNPSARARIISLIGMAGLLIGVTIAVWQIAWVTEDSFITLRYVSNLLAGYGAVFNVGERVLGYTHPLWFMLIAVVSLIAGDPVLAAIGSGLVLTLVALALYGWFLSQPEGQPWAALAIMAMSVLVFVSSDSWLSFQTGGLENSLSHLLVLLITAECVCREARRPALLVFMLALLCLCRPDFVFFALPVGLLAARRAEWPGALPGLMLAAMPGLLWLLFAWIYYGNPLPNTGAAKLAVYPSAWHAITQGVAYVADWFRYETAAVGGAVLFLLAAVLLWRRSGVYAIALGIILQLLWVVWTGGDFMRGRFLLIVLTASVFLGGLALIRYYRANGVAGNRALAGITVALVALWGMGPIDVADERMEPEDSATGIVNERLFYSGYKLSKYLELGSPDLGHNMQDVDLLRNYIAACGSVALHVRNPGSLGYLVGPEVTLIDTLGLTDRFIARLPRANLTESIPRPGHPDKYIPLEYLAERKDVRIVPDWYERLLAADCELRKLQVNFTQDDLFLAPGNQIVQLPLAK